MKSAFDKSGQVELCGERLWGPSRLVREAGELTDYAAATVQYAYLSATGHPTVFTLLDTIVSETDSSGVVRARSAATYRGTAVLVLNAVATFYNAWDLMFVWLGHKKTELNVLSEGLERLRVAVDAA
jgi:hypothetical protein